jgi:hypothetical protein
MHAVEYNNLKGGKARGSNLEYFSCHSVQWWMNNAHTGPLPPLISSLSRLRGGGIFEGIVKAIKIRFAISRRFTPVSLPKRNPVTNYTSCRQKWPCSLFYTNWSMREGLYGSKNEFAKCSSGVVRKKSGLSHLSPVLPASGSATESLRVTQEYEKIELRRWLPANKWNSRNKGSKTEKQ